MERYLHDLGLRSSSSQLIVVGCWLATVVCASEGKRVGCFDRTSRPFAGISIGKNGSAVGPILFPRNKMVLDPMAVLNNSTNILGYFEGLKDSRVPNNFSRKRFFKQL